MLAAAVRDGVCIGVDQGAGSDRCVGGRHCLDHRRRSGSRSILPVGELRSRPAPARSLAEVDDSLGLEVIA
ncbi:MAG: hypothetical protein R2710_04240 [Acidimicrobiales bacterium]